MRVLRGLDGADLFAGPGSVEGRVLRNMNTWGLDFTYLFSKTLGSTTQTTTRLVTIKARATKVMRKTLPRLAGNFPRMIQYWHYKSACVHYGATISIHVR